MGSRALFIRGRDYQRRTELHDRFGGQRQGGIATPKDHPFVLIFTAQAGAQHGYRDHWVDDDTFEYWGEGHRGDMQFVRGNRAIRDHAKDGRRIYLFEKTPKSGWYRFIDEMRCDGHRFATGLDTDGNERQEIVFRLMRVPHDEEVLETLTSEPVVGSASTPPPTASVPTVSLEAPTRIDVPLAPWIGELLGSSVYTERVGALRRLKLDDGRVATALSLLHDRDGMASFTSMSQALGIPLSRVSGFLAVLAQCLNVDGAQVLQIDARAREARFDESLLFDSFGMH